MTMLKNQLTVSICKICQLGLIKDGKIGMNGLTGINRALTIKKCMALCGKH